MKFQNDGQHRNHKNKLTKGAFGRVKDLQLYDTLKVIPRSKRKDFKCNAQGVLNG